MKTRIWFASLSGAIALSAVALVSELWRSYLDAWGVAGYLGPMGVRQAPFGQVQSGQADLAANTGMLLLITLLYTAVFVGWGWALVRGAAGSRRALWAALAINVFVLLAVPFGTLVAYCPTPCRTIWPLMEISNWIGLLVGVLAAAALVVQLRPRTAAGLTRARDRA